MISQQHKFIFVAIPKCAGTSVRSIIKSYSEIHSFRAVYGDDYGKQLIGKILQKLFNPQKYFKAIVTNPEKHMELVSELTQPDYFMFTFTRNPYARTVSLWKYLKPKMSFPEFVDWLESDSVKSFHDLAHIKS